MLLLLSKDVNVCEISKVLVKYKIKARIDGDTIYLDDPLPDKLLDSLLEKIPVLGARNYFPTTNFETQAQTNSSIPMVISEPIPDVENEAKLHEISEAKIAEEPAKSTQDALSEVNAEETEENSEVTLNLPERMYERRIVKRGQIYRCDFGTRAGSEQGGIRPAIIIQNDKGNIYSPTTIVIPFTTQLKSSYLPTHFKFKFTKENMVDYTKYHPGLSNGYSVALAEQIQTIDKVRLIRYLGTMTDTFMDELASFICTSINLPKVVSKEEPNNFKVVSKPIEIIKVSPSVTNKPAVNSARQTNTPNNPVADSASKAKKKTTFRRDSDYDPMEKQIRVSKVQSPSPIPIIQKIEDLNEVQKELLTFANTTDIYNICSDNMSDRDKIKIVLEIFGFDSTRKGVDFLGDAIYASLRSSYYNLETLSNLVHRIHSDTVPAEIQRLIVARVKELFKMKKSPAIDFIRLVNNIIKTKGELVNE